MRKQVLLVAEDDPIDAMLIERALRRSGSGFQMVRVADGDEAIAYVEGAGAYRDRVRHPAPHLVLLDLKMRRIDGFAVLAWRQRMAPAQRLPFVVFSSSGLRQDIDRAYSLGANSYVIKPTAPDRLDAMMEALHGWWADFNVSGATEGS